MKRYQYTIVLLAASLVGAGTWTAPAWADDRPLTAEQKAAVDAKRQEDLHDKQMKGLGACVLAVLFMSVLFWGLNAYNKVSKRKAEQERQEAVPEDDFVNPYTPQLTTLPLEPPPGDW